MILCSVMMTCMIGVFATGVALAAHLFGAGMRQPHLGHVNVTCVTRGEGSQALSQTPGAPLREVAEPWDDEARWWRRQLRSWLLTAAVKALPAAPLAAQALGAR